MARKKLKKFTTLELMLSVLLLVVFIITIPLFVLSARDSLESEGNKELWCCPLHILLLSEQTPQKWQGSDAFVFTGVNVCVCVYYKCVLGTT